MLVSDVAPLGASAGAYLAGIPLHGSPGTPLLLRGLRLECGGRWIEASAWLVERLVNVWVFAEIC